MANLKEIRNRISSVNSTIQITSAMKLVSASKLKKAQDTITDLQPYATKLKEIQLNLSSSIDSSISPFSENREVNNILIIGISSNKGLCGAFNNNVFKEIKNIITSNSDKNIDVMSVGKKINDISKKEFPANKNIEIPTDLESIFKNMDYNEVSERITEKVMFWYEQKVYDKVIVVYNHFINTGTQRIISETLLPLEIESNINDKIDIDYIYNPSKNTIVNEIIPKGIKIQLYKCIIDSFASEHGARMTAMHKATDNATEIRDELKLNYNKARQAAITGEILEIVAGANAL